MIENTNTKQFYPGPILNNTLEITDFLFNDAEQIKIKHSKLNEEGILIDVDLNYPTDYEVTKVLPSDINAAEAALTASTGQITLKNVNVLAGEKLTVYRVSQIIQDKDYPRTGAFPAATHEGALDYLTMQNQEQKDEIDRALKVPISTQNFEGSLPLPIPSRALKINNDGTGFEMSEFDPDLALVTTEEFKNQAQQAALDALTAQTAAANSETVATQQSQNATTQAANAKASADKAAELNQQLTNNFNSYSKSLISTKEDGMASLANASNALRQTQITNCLLEVPQNIKVELNNGTLTIKAGSKVIVPNGVGVFEEAILSKDCTVSNGGAAGSKFFFWRPDENGWYGIVQSNCHSGPTQPASGQLWYNTSDNKIYVDINQTGTWTVKKVSFPMGIFTSVKGSIASIDQVFNGFGYIRNTIFCDKGVKGLIPNGRNEDGSLKNIEFTTPSVLVSTQTGEHRNFVGIGRNSATSYFVYRGASANYKYDKDRNVNIDVPNNVQWNILPIGSTTGDITNFQPKLPFRAVDYQEAVLKSALTKAQVVIETYVNGTSGYRIWSDGYCEQWGISAITPNLVTVTLLKPYINVNYNITATLHPLDNRTNYSNEEAYVNNVTTNSFKVWTLNNNNGTYWKTCGYIW